MISETAIKGFFTELPGAAVKAKKRYGTAYMSEYERTNEYMNECMNE